MKNRIDNCFAELRDKKRKAFIPYICAGDPNLKRERNDGIDLSLRHASGRVSAEANYFNYRLDDFIFLAPTGNIEDGLIEAVALEVLDDRGKGARDEVGGGPCHRERRLGAAHVLHLVLLRLPGRDALAVLDLFHESEQLVRPPQRRRLRPQHDLVGLLRLLPGAGRVIAHVAEQFGERYDDLREQGRRALRGTNQRVRSTARAAQDYFEANPLMIGAVGLGIGLILGAMFPLSRREREILEPIGENLRESAARQGAEVVRQVARGAEDLVE